MQRHSVVSSPRIIRIASTLLLIVSAIFTANLGVTSTYAGAEQTYLVLFKGNAVSANVITSAGGTIVASYDQIGVAVARSSNADFAATVAKDSKVEGAAATGRFATHLSADTADAEPLPDSAPATDSDSLSGLQWDMKQIHTPEAHAITGGSPSIIVGDID